MSARHQRQHAFDDRGDILNLDWRPLGTLYIALRSVDVICDAGVLFWYHSSLTPQAVGQRPVLTLSEPNPMTQTQRELPIPPAAIADAKSGEMLRAWNANQRLHCTLNVHVWEDPGNWGILLADVVRQVANAKNESDGSDLTTTIERIRELFAAELDAPTDEPSGEFLDE